MFRASQSRLLQATPSVGAKLPLHHPLPLNARESTKLLNILTTSFRKHLDKEHGPLLSEPDEGQPANPIPLQLRPLPFAQDPASHRQSPVDTHMNRVLNSPYFRSLTDRKFYNAEDPMGLFEVAVARGMMDIRTATSCLHAQKRLIINSSVLNIHDGMRDSGAGTMVLKWLISSGQTKTLHFLRDVNFCQILMQYMVAEGREEACWTWIRRSFQDIPRIFLLPEDTMERYEAKFDIITPFRAFMHAVSARPKTLDATYVALGKAAGYLKGLSISQVREVFGGSICHVIGLTKTTSWDRDPPDEANYDLFLRLIPGSRRHFEQDLARLRLLHPTKPRADEALDLLRMTYKNGPPRITTLSQRHTTAERQQHLEIRIMHVGLEASKWLLERGRLAEAEECMACLRRHFSVQLGLAQQIAKLDDHEAEAANLDMLGKLSIE